MEPPRGYSVAGLAVDWSEPLLVREIFEALRPGRPAPELAGLEQANPGPLRIQLIEPLAPTEPEGGLALPLSVLASGRLAARPDSAGGIAFPKIAPWIPATTDGASAGLEASPIAGDADWAGVRWLGRGESVDELPSIEFEGACLLSITHREPAQTRFIMINRTGPGLGRLGELRKWLQSIVAPEDWVAIHSVGPHAWVAMDGWRLGAPGDPRRPQRAGGVLELRRAKEGDPVDWLRQAGVRLRSSQSEPGFMEAAAIGNPLIPNVLAPRAWVSLPRQSGAPPAEYMATFQTPRLIERVEVAWAEASGWSSLFNPRRARLQIARESEETPRTVIVIENPDATTTWVPARPMRIRAIRIVFDEPSQIPTDSRARIAALQAWGPLE